MKKKNNMKRKSLKIVAMKKSLKIFFGMEKVYSLFSKYEINE
jgi:hypothetical protein